ncbi:hypothetical protein CROQUDRAFT_723063 [Cronartium quercuum f. sp. fusiforme G11]|uniref:Mitochondrial carrier n=1 Tax=Cronartium quercuum f. sp. fusiforme G11 TaxID=708437 RepID=A0A9P6TB98_9BASI|nr:hypothetical protein CROQUDRAFT_723063 [Cronartium quercuum f. sp. fusiforme G11]
MNAMSTSTSTIEPTPSSPRPSPHLLRPYYQPQTTDQHALPHWLDRPVPSSSDPQHSSRSSLIKELHFTFPSGSSSSSKSPTSLILNHPSPSNSFLSDLDMDFNPNAYATDLPNLLRSYFNAGLMGFTSTAMVMPFEVGKTLMQVQWIPKDDELEDSLTLSDPDQLDDLLEDSTQAMDEDEGEDKYFTDNHVGPRVSLTSSSRRSLSGTTSKYNINPTKTSSKANKSNSDDREPVRPEYILPVTVQGGVTDMIKQIFRWRGEGFIALWKGQLTTFLADTLSSTLQPLLLSALSVLFSTAPSSMSLPLEHHAYPALPLTFSVASYMLTGFILSPLDLVRTRLIVQSSQLRYRKYGGPLDALRQLVRDEGGWTGLYLHPALALPALLDNLIRPALHLATPLLIDRVLQIDRLDRPVLHGLAGLTLANLSLLLILPLETVRKRLQLQSRATDPQTTPLKPCVALRPRPYAGMIEAVYRILTEETSQPRPRRHRRKVLDEPTPTSTGSGLRQLYRGFNVGLTANVVAFVLGLLGNPLEAGTSGWAEV